MAVAARMNSRRIKRIMDATHFVLTTAAEMTDLAELQALLVSSGFKHELSEVLAFVTHLRKNYPLVITGTWHHDKIRSIFGYHLIQRATNAMDPLKQAIVASPKTTAAASRRYNAEKRKEAIADMCARLSTKKWHNSFGLSRLAFLAMERRLAYFLVPSKHATLSALSPRETLLTALFYCRSGEGVTVGWINVFCAARQGAFDIEPSPVL